MQTMTLSEFTQHWDELAEINIKAACEFRDAIWNIHGKYKGIGLGKISKEDLIELSHEIAEKYARKGGKS